MKRTLSGIALLTCLCTISAAQNLITTVAGGAVVNNGDGGQADSALLKQPYSVAKDLIGNIYVADADANTIRKVDPSGIITTLAGTGTAGFSGDGGAATSAKLHSPMGLSVDASGNVYVADYQNNRIRKINSSGIISTVAGTGLAAYSGDGGPATSAAIRYPMDLAFDKAGNLYIADAGNNRVRRMNTSGIISTFAGTGTSGNTGNGGIATAAKIDGPSGLTTDTLGNVYISVINCIRKINSSGVISIIAGTGVAGYSGDGGPALSAQMNYPLGISCDRAGNVFFADFNNNCIRVIDSSGTITRVAGTAAYGFSGDGGLATLANLSNASDILWDVAGLFIADEGNGRVRKVDSNDMIQTVIGCSASSVGDGSAATSASLQWPSGLTFDNNGNMFIADYTNNRIRMIDPSGIITTVAGKGTPGFTGDGGSAVVAELNGPQFVALDTLGNILVAEFNNNCIRKIDMGNGTISTLAGTGTAGYSGDGGLATSAQLKNPSGVVADKWGNIYIADGNNRIRVINGAGIISTLGGTGTAGFSGDGGPATSAAINWPEGMAVDSAGDLYFADSNNHRIRKIDKTGVITTVAGSNQVGYGGDGGSATSARLWYPASVTFDAWGQMYIADAHNNRIRKVNSNNIISTVAGTFGGGFGGDGGPATAALLSGPADVHFDQAGNLYIADMDNNRIRMVSSLAQIDPVLHIASPLNVSPNPSVSRIEVASASILGHISVWNAQGKIVLQTVSKNKREALDIANLENGIYFLNACYNKQNSSIKFIVTR